MSFCQWDKKKKIRTFIHVKALLKMFHLYPSFSAERKPEYFLLPRPSVIWLLLFPLAASHTSHLSYLHVLAVLLSFFGFYAHCFLPFCFFFSCLNGTTSPLDFLSTRWVPTFFSRRCFSIISSEFLLRQSWSCSGSLLCNIRSLSLTLLPCLLYCIANICLYRWFSVGARSSNFVLQKTFGNIWGHFWLSQVRGRCCSGERWGVWQNIS